jgi:hypothetical protein
MSGELTDARIEQLKSLRDKRDELIGKIEKEKEGMQAIPDSGLDGLGNPGIYDVILERK